jgi:hypothetical protein
VFQFYPFHVGQVSVTGTATQIVPANTSRSGIVIIQHGTTDVFLGEANVTTSTGALLVGTKGAGLAFSSTSAIYGITSGAAQIISFLETQ